jgi:hypothetical protein
MASRESSSRTPPSISTSLTMKGRLRNSHNPAKVVMTLELEGSLIARRRDRLAQLRYR